MQTNGWRITHRTLTVVETYLHETNNMLPEDFSENAAGSDGRIRSNLIKDTVIILGGGYVVVAFKVNNPGNWFLHCHIEVHHLEGMGVPILEHNHMSNHRAPPGGINQHGHFDWWIQDYKSFLEESLTCRAVGVTVPVLTSG